MTRDPDEKPPKPPSIDYRSPDYSSIPDPRESALWKTFSFIGGFLGGVAAIIVLVIIGGTATANTNTRGTTTAFSVLLFFAAAAILGALILVFIYRPRRAMPFLLGLCIGGCITALLAGVCFSIISSI